MKTLIFVVVLAAAVGFFIRTMIRYVRAAARGTADPRPRLDQIPGRLASVLIYFFGQKKVAKEGPQHMSSKHHLLIFWGFLIITIATAEILINGVVPWFTLDTILPHSLYIGVKWVVDLFNLVVLVVIGWALFRRIVIRPHLIPMNLDAGLILGAIAALMITHFLYHGFHAAEVYMAQAEIYGQQVMQGVPDPTEPRWLEGAPVSNIVGSWLVPISVGAANLGAEASYWLHVAIVLMFLNYLPYSKHIHVIWALPNIFARNLSPRRMDLPKLDLEDEEQWGVGRIDQFSWKSLIDNYACTECARCTNYCPAYATGKNLSPMQLVHDLRYEMLDRDTLQTELSSLEQQKSAYEEGMAQSGHDDEHKPADLVDIEERITRVQQRLEEMPPLLGGRITDDTLWACTTCGACQEVCPVFIEHPLKIIQMRQNLVLEQERTPGELGRMFRNIERQSNPWGIANDKRMDWAEGLEVSTIEDNPQPEYILWVGCAGAFDQRIIKQTRAMVKILHAAGVDYAVLGHAEGCTGDPARRAGNEMLFQMQAETNVETLGEAGAKKVITSCPHCLHTLRHDYPQFGGDYEVIHHTALISHLMQAGKLKPESDGTGNGIGAITYHDSCYMGRWNREFDAPRQILQSLPGTYKELTRSREYGFCCGAGGARMYMEEEGPRVNVNRTDEILAAEVETVAVGCPFCNIMLTDGMKERDREEDVAVLDVAEIVADRIPDVPASALVRHRKAEA